MIGRIRLGLPPPFLQKFHHEHIHIPLAHHGLLGIGQREVLATTTPMLARTLPATALADTTVGEPATYKLTVVFANVRQRTGMIYIGLANDEASFNGSLYRKTRVSIPASGGVTVSFESLPAGTYAVRVYQDLNENAKLDWAGPMPTEPYGFSNVQQLLGPPKFSLCSFNLTADKQVGVTLIDK